MPSDNEFTRILQWPGYRVYEHKIDEKRKTLDLWVRRKRGNRKLECSGCGRRFEDAYDCNERAVRDLPWSEFKTTVHIEVYRVKCPKLRRENREGAAAAAQGAVQQAVRGCHRTGVRKRIRAAGGYKNLRCLLLKAQRMAATRTEFVVFRKAA